MCLLQKYIYIWRTYYLWTGAWAFSDPNEPVQHHWCHNDPCPDSLASILPSHLTPRDFTLFPGLGASSPTSKAPCPPHLLSVLLAMVIPIRLRIYELWFPVRWELYSGQTNPSGFVLHRPSGPDGWTTFHPQPHLDIPIKRKQKN